LSTYLLFTNQGGQELAYPTSVQKWESQKVTLNPWQNRAYTTKGSEYVEEGHRWMLPNFLFCIKFSINHIVLHRYLHRHL